MRADILLADTTDLRLHRGDLTRAANVLSVQLGDLEYAPNFGVDLKYFLETEFKIQNESFKAYCVQRLLEHQINVVNVLESIEPLINRLTYMVGDSDTGTELIG